MHYDEMEECGEMLANVRSFGMSNENLLHRAQILVNAGSGYLYYVVLEKEILASQNNQVMCEKTKQHHLISEDRRLYFQPMRSWKSRTR